MKFWCNILTKTFLFSIILSVFVSCGEDDKVLIGLCIDDYVVERWHKDRDYMLEKAKELGAEVLVEVAYSYDMAQIEQAKKLIEMGVDVLIIVPTNKQTAAEIVTFAHQAGVPVIAYSRLIENCDLDFYVSTNNVTVGELQAKYVLERIPKGNYIILEGDENDQNAKYLRQGHLNILQAQIDSGNVNILMHKNIMEWSEFESLMAMSEFLTTSTDRIDAVIASNDGLASGAIFALENNDRLDSVIITGQDADLQSCQQIVAGKQSMTIFLPIKGMAEAAVELAVRLANNAPLNFEFIETDNGKIMVKSILIDPIAVDKTNMKETVIAGGYHTEEEVYNSSIK